MDLKTGFVHLRQTKNRDPRRVYVPATMREHLTRMAERRKGGDPAERVFTSASGLPLSAEIRKNLSRAVKRLAEGLGLPGEIKALYGLRHGFATHHAMNGTPLPVVSGMLGHKRLEQVNAYAHFLPQAAQKWQESAFGTYVDLALENERLKREIENLKSSRTNNVPYE